MSYITSEELPGNCCFGVIYGYGGQRTARDEAQFREVLADLKSEEYGGVISSLNPSQVEDWEPFLLREGFKPIVDHCFNPHTGNQVRVYLLDWDLQGWYEKNPSPNSDDYYDDDDDPMFLDIVTLPPVGQPLEEKPRKRRKSLTKR